MDKKKISEKINFIREAIKHYLEESVLHGVMDLEKAVANFKKANPELVHIMANILEKYHWHAKQSAVEEHVVPAVEKGQLFLAEKLLRDILAYEPSGIIFKYGGSKD